MALLSKKPEVEIPPLAEKRVKNGIISEISTNWTKGIRNSYKAFRRTFWPTTSNYSGTQVTYAATRSLYRNDDPKANLGSGVCRRLINSSMDFIGLPRVVTGDEIVDEFLDKCIGVFWSSEILAMYRNACRDADTVVRVRRDDPDDPLVSAEEWESCYLEIVDPERVVIYRNMENAHKIDTAYVRHEIDEVIEEANVSGRAVTLPQTRQHVIIEEITPDEYRYYDETEGKWRDELARPNSWGFVPLHEVHNEFESYLEGGQSDYEPCLPFIMALHDVMGQTLMAHKAHSIPKAKFKVNDMLAFLANNWPDAFETDANGNPIPGSFNGEISWKGTEILFMEVEEDVDFLEAQSVLGDSKVLMEFIINCIAITSEVPHSILMNAAVDNTSENEMAPFVKKIDRKRNFFTKDIQAICKMVLAINHMEPVRVSLAWDEITPQLALVKAQALQQDVMSAEVLATREVISDQTVRSHLRPAIPSMKASSAEAKDATGNKQLPVVTPNSVSGSDSGQNA